MSNVDQGDNHRKATHPLKGGPETKSERDRSERQAHEGNSHPGSRFGGEK